MSVLRNYWQQVWAVHSRPGVFLSPSWLLCLCLSPWSQPCRESQPRREGMMTCHSRGKGLPSTILTSPPFTIKSRPRPTSQLSPTRWGVARGPDQDVSSSRSSRSSEGQSSSAPSVRHDHGTLLPETVDELVDERVPSFEARLAAIRDELLMDMTSLLRPRTIEADRLFLQLF